MHTSQTALPKTNPGSIGVFLLTLALLLGSGFFVPAAAADKTLAEGTWVKKTQTISGHWQIVERAGERFLVVDDQFKTRSAPDLKFVFSKKKIEDVESKTALSGARILAPLPGAKGRFEVRLPADLDLSQYESLLIHCEQYTKLWGGANLR